MVYGYMYHLYMSYICQRFRDLEIYGIGIHASFIYELRISEIQRFRDLWYKFGFMISMITHGIHQQQSYQKLFMNQLVPQYQMETLF